MAGLFSSLSAEDCRLLDPGAGIGSLSAAFLERAKTQDFNFRKIEVSAFEIDELLHKDLHNILSSYTNKGSYSFNLVGGDFILEGLNILQFSPHIRFTHTILNPPYKKIATNSQYRLLLRQAGIETVNLYTGFIALSLALLRPGGELVAIVPRSFCNGPYYRPFREFIFERSALEQIHLFHSRESAFKDDGVLQENVIIKLVRDKEQGEVRISTSSNDEFADMKVTLYSFDQIVSPDDPEKFIHVPASLGSDSLKSLPGVRYSLDELGVAVSTGPVVSFRVKNHLSQEPGSGTAPLLYPGHFTERKVQWPKVGKKPNAIAVNTFTKKWLYPTGHYCVVRRFTSKEERRRLVASVVEPTEFSNARLLGFDNHLNIFHSHKAGLAPEMAHGLCIYLNSAMVDNYFRRFSGHTQVNATDLKTLKYLGRDALLRLGAWALEHPNLTDDMIDKKVEFFVHE